jgi:hypothetical protein
MDIALEPELDAEQLAELAMPAEQNGIRTIRVTGHPQRKPQNHNQRRSLDNSLRL